MRVEIVKVFKDCHSVLGVPFEEALGDARLMCRVVEILFGDGRIDSKKQTYIRAVTDKGINFAPSFGRGAGRKTTAAGIASHMNRATLYYVIDWDTVYRIEARDVRGLYYSGEINNNYLLTKEKWNKMKSMASSRVSTCGL